MTGAPRRPIANAAGRAGQQDMNKPHTCSCAAAMICGPRPRAPLRDGQPDGLVGREHHTPENVLPREHGPICEAEPPQISAHCAWGPCPQREGGTRLFQDRAHDRGDNPSPAFEVIMGDGRGCCAADHVAQGPVAQENQGEARPTTMPTRGVQHQRGQTVLIVRRNWSPSCETELRSQQPRSRRLARRRRGAR